MNTDKVKQLRQETDISIQKCKQSLQEADGDLEQAKEILKKKGQEIADKKSERETKEGIIESYIHSDRKVGAMVKLSCETDFVARSDEFQKLAHELCLQIAAEQPKFLNPEDIPEDFLDGERKIYREQVKDSGKPEEIKQEIVEGKLNKYKNQISLMTQTWIRDDTKTIEELINQYIAKLGENIELEDFTRFEI
ncbi:elongation factor Ts [candidate division MSBL1 archaeon SCGC-AAA382N08]|uniref:Elongation factor Ts n=1 Tax=candidate division MSBL1 archaeon SCGC-AAA382N08 TaxID=1698285 RepID=A0A133VQZ9_9EURY|nr:elongation factor Ts [candidate division MSBL1 archaeon SCGC-AAA382N08]